MRSAFGHAKVSALDGGLPRWIAEGGEVEVGDVPDVGESEYLGAKGPEPSFVKCTCGSSLSRSGYRLISLKT